MAEVTAVEAPQETPTTGPEAEQEVSLLDDAVDETSTDDGKDFKFDREKAQKQNRKIANLERQLEQERKERAAARDSDAKWKADVEAKLTPKEVRTQEASRNELDDIMDDLKALHADDSLTVGDFQKQMGRIGSLVRKLNDGDDIRKEVASLKEQLEDVGGKVSKTAEHAGRRAAAEEAFNDIYPALEGQYGKLTAEAFRRARAKLGEDASNERVSGLADGYLEALADRASKATKPKGDSTIDKTAVNKSATSTKGAANAKTGAAPTQDRSVLENMSQDQLYDMFKSGE